MCLIGIYFLKVSFAWDPAKNEPLKSERGISFEELEIAIGTDLLTEFENPGYPGQQILIVRCRGMIWAIAAETRGKIQWLATAYPSRKWRKKYGP